MQEDTRTATRKIIEVIAILKDAVKGDASQEQLESALWTLQKMTIGDLTN